MGANCTTCQTCNGEPEFNDSAETPINPRSSITALQNNSKKMYQQKTNTKYVTIIYGLNKKIGGRDELQDECQENYQDLGTLQSNQGKKDVRNIEHEF